MSLEPKRLKVDNTISFIEKDCEGVLSPHQDTLIILAWIAGWRIKLVMINTGSSADILFNHCYELTKHVLEPKLQPYDHDFLGSMVNLLSPKESSSCLLSLVIDPIT